MKSSLLIAIAFLAIAGCSSTSDSTTDGGTAGDTATGGDTATSGDSAKTDTATGGDSSADVGTDAGDPCTDCLKSNCATEGSACAAEKECTDALACVAACTSTDCINTCVSNSKNPDGTSGNNKLAAYLSCATSKCKSQCSTSP
jgi:hypothetical protein